MKYLIGVIAIILLCTASAVYAEGTLREAKIADLDGTVEVRIQKDMWIPATPGMVLTQGDMIRTKAGATATLALNGSGETATITIEESSQLELAQLAGSAREAWEATLLDLAIGKILIHAKKLDTDKSRFEVKTPTSIVGVRGTTFSVAVEAVD